MDQSKNKKGTNCALYMDPNPNVDKQNGEAEDQPKNKKIQGALEGKSPYIKINVHKLTTEAFETPEEFYWKIRSRRLANGTYSCKSCIQIDELLAPMNRFRLNYVLNDEEEKCNFCWQFRKALDLTIEELFEESMRVKKEPPSSSSDRNETPQPGNQKDILDSYLKESGVEHLKDIKVLSDFFSRLVRSATINRMKYFSRSLEKILTSREIGNCESCAEIEALLEEREAQVESNGLFKTDNACESCDQLRQIMYFTISKVYEEKGMKTDFPIVQKFETFALLLDENSKTPDTPPDELKSLPVATEVKRIAKEEKKKKKRTVRFRNLKRLKIALEKKVLDETANDEHWATVKARIKRHKNALEIAKWLHLMSSVLLSIALVMIVTFDWVTFKGHNYEIWTAPILVLLFIICLHNVYVMCVLKVYDFSNYFPIPLCWTILSVTDGHCNDTLLPPIACANRIHQMCLVYVLYIFLEYYIYCGIHAILVLEINRYYQLPLVDLAVYSYFNFPLMIVVMVKFMISMGLEFSVWLKERVSVRKKSDPESNA